MGALSSLFTAMAHRDGRFRASIVPHAHAAGRAAARAEQESARTFAGRSAAPAGISPDQLPLWMEGNADAL